MLFEKKKVGNTIKTIGDYSFDIYLMHNPYCVALSAIILNKIIGLPATFVVVVSTIIGVILPMFISRQVIRKENTVISDDR